MIMALTTMLSCISAFAEVKFVKPVPQVFRGKWVMPIYGVTLDNKRLLQACKGSLKDKVQLLTISPNGKSITSRYANGHVYEFEILGYDKYTAMHISGQMNLLAAESGDESLEGEGFSYMVKQNKLYAKEDGEDLVFSKCPK